MQDLNNLVTNFALKDCIPINGSFTWTNKRKGFTHIAERLDSFFANPNWISAFGIPNSTILPLSGFDHFALQIEVPLILVVRKGKPSFKFQKMWFRDFFFLPLLQKWWVEAPFIQGSRMFQFCKKFQWLKLNIKEWNTSSFQKIFQAKSQIENKIKDLNILIIQKGIDQNTYKLQKELNAHLQEILATEELFWKQKSRETWLQEGDRNTKYFHALVKMRRSHNLICQIKNGEGNIIVDANKIQQQAVSFFSTLFTNGVPDGIEIR